MDTVYSREFLRMLAVASPTTVGPCVIKLFKNDLAPGVDSVIADFVEADFSGYAAIPHVAGDWSAPLNLPGPSVGTQTPLDHFEQTATTISNVVYGFWLEQTGPPVVLVTCGRFDTPQNMASIGDTIDILNRLAWFLGTP